MPTLSINLLGTFQVTLRGESVASFESDKARALLAYLAVEADLAHRRERLAGMLWPDSTERAARSNLRHILSNIRNAIGDRHATPPFLHITRQTLQFNKISPASVDVTQFSELTASVNQFHPEALAEAVPLYQGPFLDGFSLPDSPDFEEWLLVTREQLARQMQESLQQLTTYHENQGAYQAALPFAWRWVELDSWREDAYQSLMRLLAYTGQRSLALIQYETCRQVLARELGVEPAPETIALYDKILAGPLTKPVQNHQLDIVLSTTTQSKVLPHVSHNLPVQLTSFVGRQTEITQLSKYLADPDCRLISLIGIGGVGKTRLVLKVAQTLIEQAPNAMPFVDGVYFIPLAALQQTNDMIPAIAEAIGYHFHEGADPQAQLLAYLGNKAMLLILDNFEHLLDAAIKITDFLLAAPALKVLVTSRISLNLHEEWVYPLAGLQIPDSAQEIKQEQDTDLWMSDAGYSAVQLFAKRAQQVQPHFDLTQNALSVLQICRLLDGLPLGIELAAASIRTVTCESLAQELEQTITTLSATQRNIPDRHRNLRAVFEHSWNLLSDLEQQILARLSVFPTDFAQQAAKIIAGAPITLLNGLVEKSLLQVQTSGRYQLHPLFHEFMAEKLAENNHDHRATQRQHSDFYLGWLRPLLQKLQRSSAVAVSQQIITDYENARLAVTWQLDHGNLGAVDGALDTLNFFLMNQGRYHDGERICKLVDQSCAPSSTSIDLKVKITGAIWCGYFQHHLGETALARENLVWSLAQLANSAANKFDPRPLEALASLFLASLEADSDRTNTKALLDRSLQLYQALDEPWGKAEAWHALGWYHKFTGQMDKAKTAFEKTLELRRNLGNEAWLAEALSSMAEHLVTVSTDSFETAEQYAQESLRLRQSSNHQPSIAEALANLGEVNMWRGNFAIADTYFRQSIAAYQALGANDSILATRQMSLGFIKIHLGDYQGAQKQAILSLKAAEQIHSPFAIAFSHFLEGCSAIATRSFTDADTALKETGSIFLALDQTDDLAGVRAAQAIVALYQGKQQHAKSRIMESLQLSQAANTVRAYYYALPATALYLRQTDPALAIEVHEAALRFPHVAHSHWFDDIVGQRIADLASQLPAEALATARRRGKTALLTTIIENIGTILRPG